MLPMQEARPASAHLFIVNPLTGGGLLTLFSTHPPMEERIARLEAMDGFAKSPSATLRSI
jgi:heat shock protein HtpX